MFTFCINHDFLIENCIISFVMTSLQSKCKMYWKLPSERSEVQGHLGAEATAGSIQAQNSIAMTTCSRDLEGGGWGGMVASSGRAAPSSYFGAAHSRLPRLRQCARITPCDATLTPLCTLPLYRHSVIAIYIYIYIYKCDIIFIVFFSISFILNRGAVYLRPRSHLLREVKPRGKLFYLVADETTFTVHIPWLPCSCVVPVITYAI